MFPIPRADAAMLAANSGAEVPIATTVRPMTRGLTFSRLANPTAPETNSSAHFHKITKPPNKNKHAHIMFIIYTLTKHIKGSKSNLNGGYEKSKIKMQNDK
jgi:hypothetical protein